MRAIASLPVDFFEAPLIDGGFAVVLYRGGGDCPAGCTEHEYWYFGTDASCAPVQAGHYLPTDGYSDGGGCLQMDGAPMWATPPPPDPTTVCGQSPPVEDISGTYQLCATGDYFRCATQGGDPPVAIPGALTMIVAQDAADPTKGTVTVNGTGYALVDGVALDAAFKMRRFTASRHYSNLPSKCPKEWTVFASYDFDGYDAPGKLGWFENRGVDCSNGSEVNECKGEGNATVVAR